MTEPVSFPIVTARFNAGVGALRVLAEQISVLGDRHDRDAVTKFARDVTDMFGGEPDEHESELADILKDSDVEVESMPDEEKLAEVKALQEEFKDYTRKLAEADIEKAQELINVMDSFMRQPPAQGRLLRRSALVMLVTYFEQLIADLVHVYYTRNPNKMPPERLLSLADLRSIGSIGDAEHLLIERESDHVLHGGLEDHLQYLTSKLKVKFKPPLPLISDLKEVFLRRNLIVHTNGRVNRTYMSKVDTAYLQMKGIREGLYLNVTGEYLRRAITIAHVVGLALIHMCWRRWAEGEERSAADRALATSIYSALVDENYEAVKSLASFAEALDLLTEIPHRVIINRAIALRDTGERAQVHLLVKRIEQERTGAQVDLAIRMLQGQQEMVLEMLPQAIADGTLPKLARNWPLFIPIRDDPRFAAAFETTPAPFLH